MDATVNVRMPQRTSVPVSKGPLTPIAPVSMARSFPSEASAPLVRHYWIPRWALADSAEVRQDILEYPSMNLVVEPHEASLHRAHRGQSGRTLAGNGWALGVLLQPGTGRRLLGASARRMRSTGVPLSELAVPGGDALANSVRDASDDDAAMIAAFEQWLAELTWVAEADAELVNAIVATVEADRSLLRVDDLAARFDLGVRRLQRLVGEYIGFSPKWLIQRYRLQEAAHELEGPAAHSLATLAAMLGYADQSHFSREFKSVVGATPRDYAARAQTIRDETGHAAAAQSEPTVENGAGAE